MIRGSYGSIYTYMANIFYIIFHLRAKRKTKEKKRLKNFPERENAINMFCQTNKESNFSIFILRLSYFLPFFLLSVPFLSLLFFCSFFLCWFGWKTFHVLFFVCKNIWVHYEECENVCTIGLWTPDVVFFSSFIPILVVVFDIEFVERPRMFTRVKNMMIKCLVFLTRCLLLKVYWFV